MRAPCAWAAAASSRTGQISPVTLEAPVTQTSAGPYGSRAARARSRVRTASSWLRGASRTVRRAERQGSSAAWCSVSKTKTSHPSGRAPASRLRESVVERVKRSSSSGRQPRKAATVALLFSKRSVERWERCPAPGGRCRSRGRRRPRRPRPAGGRGRWRRSRGRRRCAPRRWRGGRSRQRPERAAGHKSSVRRRRGRRWRSWVLPERCAAGRVATPGGEDGEGGARWGATAARVPGVTREVRRHCPRGRRPRGGKKRGTPSGRPALTHSLAHENRSLEGPGPLDTRPDGARGVRACRGRSDRGLVFTRGTPPRTEGCRTAGRGRSRCHS